MLWRSAIMAGMVLTWSMEQAIKTSHLQRALSKRIPFANWKSDTDTIGQTHTSRNESRFATTVHEGPAKKKKPTWNC